MVGSPEETTVLPARLLRNIESDGSPSQCPASERAPRTRTGPLRHQFSNLPPEFHQPHSNLTEPMPPRGTRTDLTTGSLAHPCLRLQPPYLEVGVMARSRDRPRRSMVRTG
ncbi:hypothetical protein MTO96_036806 [Rhipicephalus appendiculatus]